MILKGELFVKGHVHMVSRARNQMSELFIHQWRCGWVL